MLLLICLPVKNPIKGIWFSYILISFYSSLQNYGAMYIILLKLKCHIQARKCYGDI